MDRQLYSVLNCYLDKNEILVDKTRLKYLLQTHPEHNSLYSIADVLSELHIEHITLRTDISGLITNGFPVIVHTNEDKGKFLVIENITNDKVHYYKADTGRGTESLDSFKEKWTGVALYAARNEFTKEVQLAKKSYSERMLGLRVSLAILAGVVSFGIWSFSVDWSIKLVWLLCLNIIGLFISILLTIHEFGESNILLHKVCHLTRQTNCNEVLRSPAAKLFGWLSMSDIGLCYFSGSTLTLLLSGMAQQFDSAISWLLVLALCTLPYSVFSIWYQAFKIKKGCPLCLGVIAVLWAESILSMVYWYQINFIPVSLNVIFSLFAGFSLPIIIWMFVKPLWKEYHRVSEYEYKYLRLKNTPYVIHAAVEKGSSYEMNFSHNEIHLGNTQASLHITVAISLYCQPCSKEWKTMTQLLVVHDESVWFTVRFVGYQSSDPEFKELIDLLTEVYLQQGQVAFCDALTSWFEHKDYLAWKHKYPVNITEASQTLSRQNDEWTNNIPITYTPTVFVGNNISPMEYGMTELKYLIDEE